ncbi:MAG: hypothetical protein NVSMB4_09990 [Acidimicrobiales bacterium]
MNEPTTTIVGNLTADPELRFTSGGAGVTGFTVASTPRAKVNGEWIDGETWFVRCSVWRDQAENVAESLRKGDAVIVTGRLKSRSWEKDGVKRSTVELEAEHVGPSLAKARATVTKTRPAQQGGARNDFDDAPF